MKVCSCCKEIKELSQFSNNKRKTDGKHVECKVCASKRKKEWASKNKDKVAEYDKQWQLFNKDKKAKNYKNWQVNNRPTVRSINAKRRADERQATPPWFNKEDVQYYYNLAEYFTWLSGGFVKYHVDHVVPLRGKNVCGLHVQNNLQVINSVANLRKSNKHECNIQV